MPHSGGRSMVAVRRADRVLLHSASWEQFERILEDLGEHRVARIAYDHGTLEIMTPLPEQGLRKLRFNHMATAN
jgi:Uma2 family endonuclease